MKQRELVQKQMQEPAEEKRTKPAVPALDLESAKGPHTVIYDAENQYVKLITWEEYIAHHRQNDVAHWDEKKEKAATASGETATSFVEQSAAIVPVPTIGQASPTSAVIYDEATQTVKLIPWEVYEADHLPNNLALRKERELSRFQMHKQSNEKKKIGVVEESNLPKAFVSAFDEKRQEIILQDYNAYRPTYKQDYAMIYNPEKQSVDLIFWKDYVENYEPLFKSQWEKKTAFEPKERVIELPLPAKLPSLEPVEAPSEIPLDKPDEVRIEPKVEPTVEPPKLQKIKDDSPQTAVYDAETQTVVLMALNEYLKHNDVPKQDWTTEYDEATQSCKLAFWKPYKHSEKKSCTIASALVSAVGTSKK